MNKNTQCTWHWQVEAYDVSKWASAGIKVRLWNTSSSFLSSGDFVSEVWVLWNALGGVPIRVSVSDTHDLCVGRRARALCSRGSGVHSLWAFFFGKAPLSFVPFLKGNWGDHLPPQRLDPSRGGQMIAPISFFLAKWSSGEQRLQ